MPLFTVPINGPNGSGAGTIQVNASDAQAAVQNAYQGGNTPTGPATGGGDSSGGSSGGGGGGGGDQASQAAAAAAHADAQLAAAQAATAASNAADFAETVRQHNITQQNWLTTNGQQQQATMFSQALQTAGLTGTTPTSGGDAAAWQRDQTAAGNNVHTEDFAKQPASVQQQYGATGGTPTQQALLNAASIAKTQGDVTGLYNGQPTETAREFNTTTGVDLAKLSSTLTGPKDYFQYLNSLNQGRNIMSSLTGNQPAPAFGAPANGVQPQSLQNIMGNLGVGGGVNNQLSGPTGATGVTGASGAAPTGAGGVASSGGTNNATGVTIPGFEQFGSLPYPHQISAANWDSLGATGQSFLSGAYSAAGYNPADVKSQIDATRPAGQYATGGQGAGSPNSGMDVMASPKTSQAAF